MTDQSKLLLDYLTDHVGITQLQALNQLGIMRLSARIYELRREGYVIATNMIEVTNRIGEKCHVAEYRLSK